MDDKASKIGGMPLLPDDIRIEMYFPEQYIV